MKKYVFLTPSIGDMGGAQMYVANKLDFLKKCGWSVYVFYFRSHTKIMIPSLEPYERNKVKDMQYACQYIPSKKLKKDLEFFSSLLQDVNDVIIVETHLVSLAGWGELLAEKMNGRHIVNFLEEKVDFSTPPLSAYMEFKLKRRELFNASETILKRGFGVSFKEEYLNYKRLQKFFCTNVVDFTKNQPLCIKDADVNILTIGRLDKPYIPKLISEVIIFAKRHKDLYINFMMVGGSNSGEMEKSVPIAFQGQENINLVMFGYVFPVPINIIRRADVGVSSANSILVTAEQGVPTICIDMYDFDSIGVYGYTTTNKFHESKAGKLSLSEALEEVIFNKRVYTAMSVGSSNKEADNQFENDMSYLQQSEKKLAYYNIIQSYPKFRLMQFRFRWFVHEYIGIKRNKRG